MAVFPDKIVLKNSVDEQSLIESAIGAGGSDAIVPGEIVIGREAGAVKLYSLDQNGFVRVVAGGGAGGGVTYWGGGDFDSGVSDGAPPDGGSFD